MRSINRKRSLLVSGSVILLCMTVIVGMTWALFTDYAKVENHLQAGDLNVTLKRIGLTTNSIDTDTGYLKPTSSNEIVDFSEATTRNVFDVTDEARLVPGSSYTATMEISNLKANSSVAYDYWLEIKLDTGNMTEKEIEDLKLDEQLKLTVVSEAGTTEKLLSEGLTVNPIGTLALTESETFTVTMEFVSSATNNAAKMQKVSFDLIVHATQRTEAPTP